MRVCSSLPSRFSLQPPCEVGRADLNHSYISVAEGLVQGFHWCHTLVLTTTTKNIFTSSKLEQDFCKLYSSALSRWIYKKYLGGRRFFFKSGLQKYGELAYRETLKKKPSQFLVAIYRRSGFLQRRKGPFTSKILFVRLLITHSWKNSTVLLLMYPFEYKRGKRWKSETL